MSTLRCFVSMSVLVFMPCMASQAFIGSGDSATTALETVSPRLESAAALTPGSIVCTFSEPMLASGVMTAGNWVVAGQGAGTLAGSPDTVSGMGPYTLSWSAGEMRNGASLSVTATGLQDAVGNPAAPAHATASTAGLGTAPVFSALSVTPGTAGKGDTVTISFAVTEPLDGQPTVTVNEHEAAWVSGSKSPNFSYSYTIQDVDTPGMATVALSGIDPAGNLGTLSNSLSLEVIQKAPKLPLLTWPPVLMLLAAGVFLLRRCRTSPCEGTALCRGQRSSRKPGRFFLALFALATMACATALAAAPAVSNVTVTQGPDGTTATKVTIDYDLIAPNGPCDITVLLSKDGGADGFIHAVTTVTGDAAAVTTGMGRHLVWNIAADYPNETIANARIRVIADDHLVQHALAYGVSGGNGTVSGSVAQTVDDGADGTAVLAVADPGYHFVQWSDGILTAARTDTKVTADITVTATFEINTYAITCNVVGNGTCTATPATANHGSTSYIAVAADTGWHLAGLVDSVEGAQTGSYTTTAVTAARTVTATFVNTWAVAYESSPVAGGTFSDGAGLIENTTGETIFTVAANAGYRVGTVTVTNGTITGTGPYTLSNVTADTTVTATFIKVWTVTYVGIGCTVSGAPLIDDTTGTVTIRDRGNTGYRLPALREATNGTISSIILSNVTADTIVTVRYTKADL